MGWYLSFILLCFAFIFIRKNKLNEGIFLMVLGAFICLGYMTGSDWRAYESYYYTDFTSRMVEPGYMLCSNLFHASGVGFWFFHIFLKVICYVFLIRLLRKYSACFYLALMLFLASFGYYMFIDCPFRNVIAVFIFLSAIRYYAGRRFGPYLLLVLCAASFHLTALVGILFYFIRWDKVSTTVLVIIYAVVFMLLASGVFSQVLDMLTFYSPYLLTRIGAYENSTLLQGNMLSMGLVLRLVCLTFMCLYRKMICREFKWGVLVFSLCYTYLLFSLLAYAVPIFLRFTYYLALFYVIMVTYFVTVLKKDSRHLMMGCYLFVCLAITYTTCRSVFYVPYTNIIPYAIMGDFPDYYYRSHYNFIHTPYTGIEYKWND